MGQLVGHLSLKPQVPSPTPHKLSMVVHACNLSTGEVETGKEEIPSLPWLHREFKSSLDYMRHCIKTI